MRISIWSVAAALLMSVLFLNSSALVQAQGRPGRGTVVLKDQTVSGKQRSSGSGQVLPLGGYYVAPTVGCTLTVSNVNAPDGTQVYVTLEYVPTSSLSPVLVGTITIKGGKGALSTLNNPTPVSITAGLASMTVHAMNGSVLMTGSIRGL